MHRSYFQAMYPNSPGISHPTPPVTPQGNFPPHPHAGGEMKPVLSDLQLGMSGTSTGCSGPAGDGSVPPPSTLPAGQVGDGLRLTFPVRDGIVLPPFRLEHGLAVSNHTFHLRDSVHHTLMYR